MKHSLAAALLAAALGVAHAESPLERGRYLIQSIAACGNCHTPQGPGGPVAGQEMAGGMVIEEPPFTARVPNITPDRETGIGAWTDAQIAAAIRDGRRPDGTLIGPPMPIARYRGISDEDVAALVAYLRQVPARQRKVAKSEYRMPLPPAYGPPVGRVPTPDRDDRLAWGRYLAGPLGHCVECHSAPDANGVPDVERGLGGGGMRFSGPWGVSVAPPITPATLGRYSDAELKAIVTRGQRPDGSRLKPPMATGYYANMTAPDLDALVAYLRSLPAR